MKKTTKNDYLQSIYKVIHYIEENYNDDLTLDELSKVASFSKYHFHRIFKSITGETLSNYIRKVRLSSTTLKFKTDKKITQIALDSGYETNASFSKAFKKYFGITPKEFSKNAKKKKGNKMLEPKIVEIEPIEVLYVRKTGDYKTSAEQAWNAIVDFAYNNDLSGKVKTRYGIAHDNPSVINNDEIRYDACLEVNDKFIGPQGEVQAKQISAGKYAVFLHNGSYELLGEIYKNIGDWIVESGIELRDEPQIHKYLDLDPRKTKPENLKTEIYVPIG
jgi:AraC family transcriptional regulator